MDTAALKSLVGDTCFGSGVDTDSKSTVQITPKSLQAQLNARYDRFSVAYDVLLLEDIPHSNIFCQISTTHVQDGFSYVVVHRISQHSVLLDEEDTVLGDPMDHHGDHDHV